MFKETFGDETDVFDHIPQLNELVPHGGQPGYTYAQVCTNHLHKARKEGWSVVNRDVYIIQSDKGHAEMILMVKGEANTMLSPIAGMRACKVDNDVKVLTGLSPTRETTVNESPPEPVVKLQPKTQEPPRLEVK